MKARAEIVVAGVAVGIDMAHAERPISGNCPQDRQRDRMITADRQRRYASRMNGSEEGGDFGERQLEGPVDPGISGPRWREPREPTLNAPFLSSSRLTSNDGASGVIALCRGSPSAG